MKQKRKASELKRGSKKQNKT